MLNAFEAPLNAGVNTGYFPGRFRASITVAFLEPGKKGDTPKFYGPIALLSTGP